MDILNTASIYVAVKLENTIACNMVTSIRLLVPKYGGIIIFTLIKRIFHFFSWIYIS